MLTELQPHQQSVAIVPQLGGAAREYARAITPDELIDGGQMQGVMIDLASYIRTGLQLCCTPFVET